MKKEGLFRLLIICFGLSLLLLTYGFSYDGIAGRWEYIKSLWQLIGYFWSLNIPFLLITVALPVLCILVVLIRKPISAQRILIPQTGLAKGIFFISLFFFLLLHIYGICYYKLRLQFPDAESDIRIYFYGDLFHNINPTHEILRYGYLLNKIILIPILKLHVPLHIVGRIYCLSDCCFYLFIALAILFFTRRYDLAAVVLAAQVLLKGINFYFISMELFLSGSLMILYMAVYTGLKEGKLRNLILFPCLFFVIYSHPLTIMVLAVFMAGMYKSTGQLIKDKWILIFILFNVALRLFFLTGYDREHINELHGMMDIEQLSKIIVKYWAFYWYVVLLAVVGIYISFTRYKNRRAYLGLLFLPLVLYFCAVRKLDTDEVNFSKFIYAINLFVLMQGIVLITEFGSRYKKIIMALACIIFLSALKGVFVYHPYFMKRVHLIETLNTICYDQDPNQSKWYICGDTLNAIDIYGLSSESICFSVYQKLPIAIEVLRGVPPELKKALDTMPQDRYLISGYGGKYVTENISTLDPYYFHLKETPYRELLLDSAKLSMIKRICEPNNLTFPFAIGDN